MREMLENFSSNEQSNLSSQIKELQVYIILTQNKVILQYFIILLIESQTIKAIPQHKVLHSTKTLALP